MSDTTHAHEGPQADDIDFVSLIAWGLVSAIVTMVIIFGLYGLYNSYAAQQRVEKSYNAEGTYLGRYQEASATKKDQLNLLLEPVHWVDQEGKVAAVPLERAKELTLKEFQAK